MLQKVKYEILNRRMLRTQFLIGYIAAPKDFDGFRSLLRCHDNSVGNQHNAANWPWCKVDFDVNPDPP